MSKKNPLVTLARDPRDQNHPREACLAAVTSLASLVVRSQSQSLSLSHGVHQNGLHGVHGGLRLNGRLGLSLNYQASLARDPNQGGKIRWRNGVMILVKLT